MDLNNKKKITFILTTPNWTRFKLHERQKTKSCKRGNNHRSDWLNQQSEEPLQILPENPAEVAITTDFTPSSDS